MKNKIIFTGIGYNLLETIKYFLNYKQVEVSAVIPLNNYPNSKKFYQNLKRLQKQSFLWISSGSFDKKKFNVPNFRIGTVFYTNTIGNNLILLEKIN